MPSGPKKRAKLKKQQQQHNPNPNNSDDVSNSSNDNHLPILPNIPRVDVSEDSMESSEEVATPKAVEEVPVERAVEVVGGGSGGAVAEVVEEVTVFVAPPQAGKQQVEGEVGTVVAEAEAPALQESEAKAEQAEAEEPSEPPPLSEAIAGADDAAVPGLEEVARGPAVAVMVTAARRATLWNCCGLLDAFTGSDR